jgi:hypothetical protein
MTTGTETKELEINGMETTSSLPAKVDELDDIKPVLAEVRNQETGEFEKVMISPQDIRKYVCPTATLPELYIFMSICRNQGIDPISEAYFVKYGGNPGFTVMKYTVYMKRAMASGILKSITHEFDDEDNPTKITVTLERRDMEGEWTWTAYRRDLEQRRKKDNAVTEIWQKQYRFMMVKCAYKQALNFFCADVVGALPPIQEEMPGIGALNMPTERFPFEEEGREIQAEAEALEVNEVKELPEEMDLTPLSNTFFGMIKGMFPTDEARHKWQLEKVGVESMKKWGPAEYSKAFKALSMEAGPPNGHNDDDTESSDTPQETPTTADDTEVTDGVEKSTEEEVENPDLHSPLEDLRAEYLEVSKYMFDNEEDRNRWQKDVIGVEDFEDWDPDQFRTAILEVKDCLMKDYSATEQTAPGDILAVDMEIDISVEIDKPPVMRAKVVEIKNGDIAIDTNGVVHKYKTEAVMKFIDSGMWKIVPPEKEEELMTQEQFMELKKILAGLPKYHANLGSSQFRDRAQEITGRRPRSIRQYTVSETSDLIHEFTDELADYKRELENPKPEQKFDFSKE